MQPNFSNIYKKKKKNQDFRNVFFQSNSRKNNKSLHKESHLIFHDLCLEKDSEKQKNNLTVILHTKNESALFQRGHLRFYVF